MQRRKNDFLPTLILVILLLLGFLYRIYGLSNNYAFWTDEEHVAIFARAILERGKPVLANGFSTGIYQWLQYWLSVSSARIFGLNEFAIRFPSVIFGILTIWAVYLLGKELFDKKVGLVVAVFTTFLKIEILWSRQARPYQALQFFYLLGAFFIYKLAKGKKPNWRYLAGLLGCGFLASLMHGLGLFIFLNGFLYLFFSRLSWFKNWTFLGGIILISIISYFLRPQMATALAHFGDVNNLFYYRVFLWHNYPLLVLLALIGLFYQIFQKKNGWKLLILFLIIQGAFASFFLRQPFVRYFYIVFPFFVLLSATGLWLISRLVNKRFRLLTLIILLLLVISFENKFALFPQKAYSLNEDMQEIPEVDYKKIYAFIKKELDENPEAIYVSNWNDHPIWYLGEGKLDYLLRVRTEAPFDKDPVSGAVYIKNLEELRLVIADNSLGIILVESWDDFVPEDARQYIRQNLNKELEIDRLYPTQPRYWPVEVYSWGLK